MQSKTRFVSLLLIALVVSFATYSAKAWSQAEDKSAQDQSKAEAKAASDIKSAPSDEGQLATVNNAKIPAYAKVYVAPMPGGFENYIIAGLRNKKVPLTVMVDRSKAEYEISGVSESEKAGWAKMLFIGSQRDYIWLLGAQGELRAGTAKRRRGVCQTSQTSCDRLMSDRSQG